MVGYEKIEGAQFRLLNFSKGNNDFLVFIWKRSLSYFHQNYNYNFCCEIKLKIHSCNTQLSMRTCNFLDNYHSVSHKLRSWQNSNVLTKFNCFWLFISWAFTVEVLDIRVEHHWHQKRSSFFKSQSVGFRILYHNNCWKNPKLSKLQCCSIYQFLFQFTINKTGPCEVKVPLNLEKSEVRNMVAFRKFWWNAQCQNYPAVRCVFSLKVPKSHFL